MARPTEKKRGKPFFSLIFLGWRSDDIRELHPIPRVILYLLALVLFYLPILYFSIKTCLVERELTVFFLLAALVHFLARLMLRSAKHIQRRFSTVKTKKHFLMRTWLVGEYVVFMWLVYLSYPLACILIPFSLLVMAFESLWGSNFLLQVFMQYSAQYMLFGSVISYILFIVADGYRKLKTGFLPDYLGLYAVLTILSASAERAARHYLQYISFNTDPVMDVLSRVFALSNDAMSIVASAVTLIFAIYSLYAGEEGDGEEEEEEDTGKAGDGAGSADLQ